MRYRIVSLNSHSRESTYLESVTNRPPGVAVSLSIVLAVLGIGMNCRFTYTKAGGSQEELKTARNLIESSAAALSHSNFLEEPTLDGESSLLLERPESFV